MELNEKMSLAQYTDTYGKLCENMDSIPEDYYEKYGVKRGLRDKNGNGVLSGLTLVSKITAFDYIDGVKTPCDGNDSDMKKLRIFYCSVSFRTHRSLVSLNRF